MSKIIDNYVLVNNQVKQNYQGEISKARNLLTKEYVSIKVVKIENFVKNPEIREQILNEISINKKLSETLQCIVKIHKMLKSNNHIYIVYEFYEHDLESYVQQQHMSNNEAFQLFKKIIQIYEIISQQEIIHNNINAQNIYVNDGEIKFDGFGLARHLEQNKSITSSKTNSTLAPEIIQGGLPSQKSDMFQLGNIFADMLTNKYQYQDILLGLMHEDPQQRMDLQGLKWALNKSESKPKIDTFNKFQNNFTSKEQEQEEQKWNQQQNQQIQQQNQQNQQNNNQQNNNSPNYQNYHVQNVITNNSQNFSSQNNSSSFSQNNSQGMMYANLNQNINSLENNLENKKMNSVNDNNLSPQALEDLNLFLLKERNKYNLVLKILQNLAQLNINEKNKAVECGFILIILAKQLNNNIQNLLSDQKNMTLLKFFKNNKHHFEFYKQTPEYMLFLQQLKSEANDINVIFNCYKQQITQSNDKILQIIDYDEQNINQILQDQIRIYIQLLENIGNKIILQGFFLIFSGNEQLALSIYIHMNDLLDILNLNSFFEKMIKKQPVKLSKQLYYEHLSQCSLEVMVDVVKKKIENTL